MLWTISSIGGRAWDEKRGLQAFTDDEFTELASCVSCCTRPNKSAGDQFLDMSMFMLGRMVRLACDRHSSGRGALGRMRLIWSMNGSRPIHAHPRAYVPFKQACVITTSPRLLRQITNLREDTGEQETRTSLAAGVPPGL